METCPGEGVVKEEKLPHSRKPSYMWVCGEFCDLRRQHNWEKTKNRKPTEYMPNLNYRKENFLAKSPNLTT